MLKITTMQKNGSEVILKLAGKIQGEWVTVLADEYRKAQRSATQVAVDLRK